MSSRLEMLQVARLAPRQLAEAADLLAEFLLGELGDSGGAKDRAGQGDLYYTAFALDGLVALQADLPRTKVSEYLTRFGQGEDLDLVHLSCLVRCWTALGREWPGPDFPAQVAARVEAHRSADGGYGVVPGCEDGALYSAFLILGVYQDLGLALPEPDRMAASIERLRTEDGGYANVLDLSRGTTPTTAAAATILRQIGHSPSPEVGRWLLARAHPSGGFLATPLAPVPDLLSTATALHALHSLNVSTQPLRERCLDFVDSLWTGRAFVGTWDDDDADSEYVFYALLALGHLSL